MADNCPEIEISVTGSKIQRVFYVKIADAENQMLKHVDECNLEHGKIASKGNFLCRKFQGNIEGIFLHPKIPSKPRLLSRGEIQGFFDIRRHVNV